MSNKPTKVATNNEIQGDVSTASEADSPDLSVGVDQTSLAHASRTLHKPGEPVHSGQQPAMTALQELHIRERAIEENLEILDKSQVQVAIADHLFAIENAKLYKAAGFRSLRAYVKSQFPHRKKSRIYQLLHFGQARYQAMQAGAPIPDNERQSRRNPTRAPDNQDPFAQFWVPIYNYLEKKFSTCPAAARTQFVEMVELEIQSFRARIPNGPPQKPMATKPSPNPLYPPSQSNPVIKGMAWLNL